MSYWIGMFSVGSFFSGIVVCIFFSFFLLQLSLCIYILLLSLLCCIDVNLCVYVCVWVRASFALCHSSRFSFLLAIIFCTRPTGVFVLLFFFFFLFRFVFLSLFANRHVLFVCHRFSFLFFTLTHFLSIHISLEVTSVPISYRHTNQKKKHTYKIRFCNRKAMAVSIIKNKANENESEHTSTILNFTKTERKRERERTSEKRVKKNSAKEKTIDKKR